MSFGHINSQPHRHGPTPRRPSFEKTKVRKERKKRTTRILVPQAGPLRSFQAIHRRKIHRFHGAAQVTWLSFTDYRVITGMGHPKIPKTAEKPQFLRFLGALLTSGRTGKRCISPVFVGSNCHCSR